MTTLIWTKVDPEGPGLHMPQRPGDAGYDLAAAEGVLLAPGQLIDLPTNVRVKLPDGHWAEIRPRSSIALKGIVVSSTVIDENFTGELHTLIKNANRSENSHTDWQGQIRIAKGQRIAQLMVHQRIPLSVQHVDQIEHDPRRGPLGFGSSD